MQYFFHEPYCLIISVISIFIRGHTANPLEIQAKIIFYKIPNVPKKKAWYLFLSKTTKSLVPDCLKLKKNKLIKRVKTDSHETNISTDYFNQSHYSISEILCSDWLKSWCVVQVSASCKATFIEFRAV